jgi:hypothetical protein
LLIAVLAGDKGDTKNQTAPLGGNAFHRAGTCAVPLLHKTAIFAVVTDSPTGMNFRECIYALGKINHPYGPFGRNKGRGQEFPVLCPFEDNV